MATSYYEPYKDLHDETKKAIQCDPSVLKGKVDKINDTMQSMHLIWNDSVSSDFESYKTIYIDILTNISNSIATDFESAKEAYDELKPILDELEKDDADYLKLCDNEPSLTITKTEYLNLYGQLPSGAASSTDENVSNPAHAEWSSKKSELVRRCSENKAKLQPYIRILQDTNRIRIASDIDGISIQSGIPTFELPSDYSETPTEPETTDINENTSTEFTSDGSMKGNAFDIWKYFKNKGLSDVAVAGILGNVQAECSFNPNLYESDGTQKNPRQKGYGIMQWTNYHGMKGGRRDQLFDAAGSEVKAKELEFQCDYLWDEVFTPRSSAIYNHSGNPDYYAKLKATNFFTTDDPVEAARLFHNIVEGSADSYNAILKNRGGAANNWYDEFSKVDG